MYIEAFFRVEIWNKVRQYTLICSSSKNNLSLSQKLKDLLPSFASSSLSLLSDVVVVRRCHWLIFNYRTGDSSIHRSSSVLPSIRPSVRLYVRPSVHPSVRTSVRPSFRPSVRPYVCTSVLPSIRPSVRLNVRPVRRCIVHYLFSNHIKTNEFRPFLPLYGYHLISYRLRVRLFTDREAPGLHRVTHARNLCSEKFNDLNKRWLFSSCPFFDVLSVNSDHHHHYRLSSILYSSIRCTNLPVHSLTSPPKIWPTCHL